MENEQKRRRHATIIRSSKFSAKPTADELWNILISQDHALPAWISADTPRTVVQRPLDDDDTYALVWDTEGRFVGP